jgi:hypothetical protein
LLELILLLPVELERRDHIIKQRLWVRSSFGDKIHEELSDIWDELESLSRKSACDSDIGILRMDPD